MRKRFGLFISLIVLTSLIIGCSSNSSSGDGDSVTLTVWGDADNQAILESSFDKINDAFTEKYPEIDLEYEYSGSLESIDVALQSDSLPDLFWVQGNKSTKMAEMARNDYLLPLDDYDLDYSRFSDEAIEYAQVDGTFYSSLPSFIAYVTMYYNEDIFDEYGLEVPTTWDEFEEISETIAENDLTPISVGGNGDFSRYWVMQAMAAS